MNREIPWFDQDRFWETVEKILFHKNRIEHAGVEVDSLVELLDLAPHSRILDFCCGVGRHSLVLAQLGHRVTGMDRTDRYLQQARASALEKGLDVEFVKGDMRTFNRPDCYDAVINLFTSFGFFEDIEDDRRTAMNMLTSLRPGGKLIMDMMSKEILARIFNRRTWYEVDGMLVLEEHQLMHNWGWIDNRWLLLDGEERQEVRLSHRLYSAVELIDLLSGVGFTGLTAFGSLDGLPYDHRAQRMIVTGSRPELSAATSSNQDTQ
ncbi:class I SAM-dependent methyltransferase [bacterium]|nr:class I SAM-dependent methyltransferase [candidate division CSSED10-310 bacterium]